MGRLIYFFFILHFTSLHCQNNDTIAVVSNKLITINSGAVVVGNNEQIDAIPHFKTKVKAFQIQEHEISNAEFAVFVRATAYQTLAEKKGGSYIFNPALPTDSNGLPQAPWWHFQQGANWFHPDGPQSNIDSLLQHPVVHIAYQDACAYCKWLSMRLPTEIEREYAARKNGFCTEKNIWQGNFPDTNLVQDGFSNTSPVGSFPAGKLGIYDMQGNVWEWCADPYSPFAYTYAKGQQPISSTPLLSNYFDPNSPSEETRVIRGGSFLCAPNYCCGYNLGMRMRSSVNMSFSHIGFRCVKTMK
jgi:formylglycine-generating enzyme required for sulfatase activity